MSEELVVKALDVDEARRLTDDIKTAVAMTWDLIQDAYRGRAWAALGYSSWDGYCESEFGTSRLRLPREERPGVVGSLREAGLSVRAIASAMGESKSTIGRDLAGVPNGTDEVVTGVDGKVYPAGRWSLEPTLRHARDELQLATRLIGSVERDPSISLALLEEMRDLAIEARDLAAGFATDATS